MASVVISAFGGKDKISTGDVCEFGSTLQPKIYGLQFWFEPTGGGAPVVPAFYMASGVNQYLQITLHPSTSEEKFVLFPVAPGMNYLDFSKFGMGEKFTIEHTVSGHDLYVTAVDKLLPPLPPLPWQDPLYPPLPPLS